MSSITKYALAESLKELLKTKSINHVTINDITENCGINRMTFYYHFHDIYDLVGWICSEEIAKAVENNRTYETWQQAYLNTFYLIKENHYFVMNIYHHLDREYIENYLYKIIFDIAINIVEEKAENMTVSEDDKHFITEFYVFSLIGIILKWLKGNMKEDPKQIVNSLNGVVLGNIEHALEHFRTDKD